MRCGVSTRRREGGVVAEDVVDDPADGLVDEWDPDVV